MCVFHGRRPRLGRRAAGGSPHIELYLVFSVPACVQVGRNVITKYDHSRNDI
jgi:hypothetical protein